MIHFSYELKWEDELLGLRPCWTVEPSINIIVKIFHHHLKLSPNEIAQITVNFQFEGAFTKLYAIECPRRSFLIRVTLSVDPHFKTLSKVATVKLLELKISIPVLQIIASNSSGNNKLKFKWIIMKRDSGMPVAEVWASLNWEAKMSCVGDVAVIMAQLFKLKYNSIGNIFHEKDLCLLSDRPRKVEDVEPDTVVLCQIVSMILFWGTHLAINISWGPFASTQDWMNARFQLIEEDCRRIWNFEDLDGDNIKDIENAQQLRKQLQKYLDFFFSLKWEEFSLHHDNISQHNLTVDSKRKLQVLVDWECVSVMLLWKACQIPFFIDTLKRTERPNSENYMKNADGSINLLYHEHLNEYKYTHLQDYFLKKMTRLAPQWIEEYQTLGSKIDFDNALQNCDGGIWTKKVQNLLNCWEAEEKHWSLDDF